MTNLKTAKFITFEGGEGSGKSTQSKLLHEYLLSKGISALLTREIGGTKEAESIRDLMVHSNLFHMSELLLVMAARYEHLQHVILPALNKGQWVICDRFVDSTACYQGQYKDIGVEKIYKLHNELISSLMPDLTFFIDVPPGIALERALSRPDNNKFEHKSGGFHRRIYDGFHHLAALFPQRIITIDAKNSSQEEVHQKIISALRGYNQSNSKS